MIIQFEATVRDLSHKGLGVIDHPDGRVFFARGVWPGDTGKFEIEEDAPDYTEAKMLSLSQTSTVRVEAKCVHRGTSPGQCGGCPWMIADYQSQLHFKLKRLMHAIERRKIRISEEKIKAIIPSENIYQYRNRIQLKTDGNSIGYVSEGSSIFAPVNDCLILNPVLHSLFHRVRDSLPRRDFLPGENHKWCYLDLDDEVSFENIQVNKRRPFRQGNTGQNERMKEWIRSTLIHVPRHFPVIDLFCGSGNFTEVLSSMGFENILAIEVQGVALKELEKKSLRGVRFLALDMREKGSWAKIAKHQPHAKVMIVDPPREGMEKRRGLFKYLDNLEELLYISCEMDTFTRDTTDLLKHYSLQSMTPIDLFPHTPHLEILSHFHRDLVSKV